MEIMDSLSDHASRRSGRGRGPERGSAEATAVVNRVLLLTGSLLFINGISVTFITVLIPFAINSAIVITFVTVLTALAALAVVTRRNPDRIRALVETTRPLVEMLIGRDRPRRQGGL